MTSSDQADTAVPRPGEDGAASPTAPDPGGEGSDPRDTKHPVGAEQAQRNADDEPAG